MIPGTDLYCYFPRSQKATDEITNVLQQLFHKAKIHCEMLHAPSAAACLSACSVEPMILITASPEHVSLHARPTY